jgi:hypothetical protein
MDKVSKKYKLDRGFKWISKKNESAGTLAVVTSNCNQIDKKTKGEKTIADFKTFGDLRNAYQAILDDANKESVKGANDDDDKEPKTKGKKTVTIDEAIKTLKNESMELGYFLEYALKHGGLDGATITKGISQLHHEMIETKEPKELSRIDSLNQALAH